MNNLPFSTQLLIVAAISVVTLGSAVYAGSLGLVGSSLYAAAVAVPVAGLSIYTGTKALAKRYGVKWPSFNSRSLSS